MLDFGAGEFVVVGVVALIAIGPKELPGVLRTIGRSVGKMRRMAGDFQNQFNDAMREMELEEARKKVEEMGKSVSDSVQAATHVDLDQATTTPTSTDGVSVSTPTSTDGVSASTSTEGSATAAPDLSALTASLPVVETPSADQLLAQAHSDVLSNPPVSEPVIPTSLPETAQPASQATSADTHAVAADPQAKGTSHV
jgi:sec-independent protein translocase protein TatB